MVKEYIQFHVGLNTYPMFGNKIKINLYIEIIIRWEFIDSINSPSAWRWERDNLSIQDIGS